MSQAIRGPIFILLCCFLWASDTLFRFPLLKNHSPLQIVFYEHLLAIFALLPFLHQSIFSFLKLSKNEKLAIVFIGVFGSGVATLCLTQSYKFLNPNVSLLLQKLQPIIAIYASSIILKEFISKKFYFWAFWNSDFNFG